MNTGLPMSFDRIMRAITPPIILDLARHLAWQVRFHLSGEKSLLRKNASLMGVGKGRRAFVLATGPSIRSQDLSRLKGEDCYSVSNFFLHDAVKILKPKFHFFAPYHPPLVLENYIEWLRVSDKALPEETRIFLGHATRSLVEEHGLFPERELHYLYLSGSSCLNRADITGPVMGPQTGPLMIIPVLFYMDYEEIYLVGCDHNSLRDYKKQITNFYEAGQDPRRNATDAGVWEGIIGSHTDSRNVFIQYEKYQALSRARGNRPRLINLSPNSWLDFVDSQVFEAVCKKG